MYNLNIKKISTIHIYMNISNVQYIIIFINILVYFVT